MKPDIDLEIDKIFRNDPDQELDWRCREDIKQLITHCLRYAKPTTAKALKEFKEKARELGLRI